jgi:hypothetical protein
LPHRRLSLDTIRRTLKRFRRILFNTPTPMSLILALATAGLWVRSMKTESH